MAARGGTALGAITLVVLALVGALVAQAPVWDQGHPVWAVGYGLIGVDFAVSAIILLSQEGQRGNAVLLVLLTLVWTTNQLEHRSNA